jgi:hypothetical protein
MLAELRLTLKGSLHSPFDNNRCGAVDYHKDRIWQIAFAFFAHGRARCAER